MLPTLKSLQSEEGEDVLLAGDGMAWQKGGDWERFALRDDGEYCASEGEDGGLVASSPAGKGEEKVAVDEDKRKCGGKKRTLPLVSDTVLKDREEDFPAEAV